ncbi:MAG: rRNA maturation RNase YbeY [Candidatus Nanopelagicales bacterium]
MSIDVSDSSGVDFGGSELLAAQASFLLDQLNLDPDCELSIALVDESEMERLHVEWMDLPGPTDVLSFPMDELRPGPTDGPRPLGVLGDIILCPTVAAQQGAAVGHSTLAEMELLLTHGVLHLLGYDHAEPDEHAVMFALQEDLLAAWRSEGTA